MSVEKWLPVIGYEKTYEVSDAGRVRRKGGRVLALSRRGKGLYLSVHLSQLGHARCRFVHILVLEAFTRKALAGEQCRHLNGDKSDCRLDNLAWGTASENNLDRVRHGTHQHSSRTHCVNGHEFSPENTHINDRGHRKCRACRREFERARQTRLKVAKS